jgi:peptide-methionine (S)-S-oxide reductase
MYTPHITPDVHHVQVTYDPKQTTFTKLLEAFADKTDLTTLNRQGSDRGTQYRSGVYYHNEQQKADTEAFFARLNEEIKTGVRRWAGKAVVSEVEPAADYYVAEGYHQQYLSKGGRFSTPQCADKGCKDEIRCYG